MTIDYRNIYSERFLKGSDGARSLQFGALKSGDALSAVAYAHGIDYSKIEQQWPDVARNNRYEGPNVRVADQLDFVKKYAIRKPNRVLEIGSGRGEVTGFLCELGYSVTSIEPSPNAAEIHARTHRALFEREYEYELLNAPINELDIDYSQYDTILMVESLEHILAEHFDPEWQKITQQFCGHFVVTNWHAYHPIKVGQYASPEIHCRAVNDALYDQFAQSGKTLHRHKSHLCIAVGAHER
jgi:SAM-dependent methyltransferase